MQDLSGQTLGRYQVLERLGRGGMAEVYRAYQPSLDRYVAIKVIYPHLAGDAGLRERFGREARAVAALRHPNVVQVYDFDVQNDVAFMAMEFISGPTLKAVQQSLQRRGRLLPLPVVGQIVGQIGEALAYAHDQQIVHRDVKPANVLIRQRGRAEGPQGDAELDELLLGLGPDSVVLTDFGVARIINDSVEHTAAGTILGSPAYMSPEQGRGERAGASSDIYSLGVVLYELLTGQVPFDADTPFAIVLKHTTAPLPPPRELRPDLPGDLERLLLKALAKDPAARFQDAGAFAAAVRAATAGQAGGMALRPAPAPASEDRATRVVELTGALPRPAPPAPPAPPPAAPAPRPRRRLLRALVAGALALAVVAFVAVVAFAAGGFAVFQGLNQAGALVVPTEYSLAATSAAAEGQPFIPPTAPPDPEDDPLGAALAACPGPGCPGGSASAALDILNAAVAQSPDDADLLAARAVIYVWWDPYTYAEQARADIAAALERDPESAIALYGRGALLAATGQSDAERAEALAAFDQAVESDPDLIQARIARARFLSLAPDFYDDGSPALARALADLDHALELEPANSEALNLRADVYYSDNQYERSLADTSQALALNPADFAALMRRARLSRYYLGQPEQALADYGAALALSPEDYEALEGRAALSASAGDYQAALADASLMVRVEPNNPASYVLRGFTQLGLGDPGAAAEDFAVALEVQPDLPDGRFGLGLAALARGEPAAAIPHLEAAAAGADSLYYVAEIFFADRSTVWLELARAYLEAGRTDEAGPALEAAIAAEGDWFRPYLLRARYHRVRGDLPAARADLRTALGLAATDEERGEVERAQAELR